MTSSWRSSRGRAQREPEVEVELICVVHAVPKAEVSKRLQNDFPDRNCTFSVCKNIFRSDLIFNSLYVLLCNCCFFGTGGKQLSFACFFFTSSDEFYTQDSLSPPDLLVPPSEEAARDRPSPLPAQAGETRHGRVGSRGSGLWQLQLQGGERAGEGKGVHGAGRSVVLKKEDLT